MYKNPATTVDIIVEHDNKIILIRRKKEPHKGKLALPGGFVEYGERVENAAMRETKEETRLDVELTDILGIYSDPKRDPRKHTISSVFVAKPIKGNVEGSDDASEAMWIDVRSIDFNNLAFDHSKILKDYLEWKRKGGTYWSTKGS